ncbi:xylose isomerase [Luteitalea sp. TBR-22]|uniref:sugar phosphate isomerase/epimerase family protein n=1 Tax=Luteitalea sp. TBR-22 TaxID=2802971 RepID=UPI001AF2C898|nr:sugar phosphate isomerase/epimerase [Luteitalea sp. TBR-22]BCS31031.1 xylose isomerase [Luteitalea sp. TBR-22]
MPEHARESLSRRGFLAAAVASPLVAALSAAGKPLVGLELFSVRQELAKDLFGTVRAVGKAGYQAVEFFSPYFQWDPAYARQVRQVLDEAGLKAPSTHNGANAFTPEGLKKAVELNRIIGSSLIVMASAGGNVRTLDDWKRVTDQLAAASETLRPLGMRAGFHNHQTEFTPIDGTRPMDIIAKGTPRDFVLQLDVGTCLHAGQDPVAWIKANPGRIASIHCKDWAPGEGPDKGYQVLTGEGVAPWKAIRAAAESVGGVETYMIEQEGSRFTPFETMEKCLATWRAMGA